MAIIKATYGLPGDQEDNPYLIAEDEEKQKKLRDLAKANALYAGTSNPIVDAETIPQKMNVPDQEEAVTGETEAPVVGETETTSTAETETTEFDTDDYLKQLDELLQSGSVSEQYKAAIMAAIKAQELTTKQAVEQLEYEKEKAEKARVKANREADMTFSRAINPTGKINQNIRFAGLAGSGWQETSQVSLTNAYQNALNTNSSDYNTAVKELNLAISQAKMSGDIATMQAIQTYAIQLAQQLYQEARDAVADAQWEKSYQLQLAAFELEKAAKAGNSNNSGYYGSGSTGSYGSGSSSRSPEDGNAVDIIDAATSKTNAANAGYAIEQMLASGQVGEDAKYYTAQIIQSYAPGMNDAYIQWLLDTYGMTQEELNFYTQ